jgi:hypothetical protein
MTYSPCRWPARFVAEPDQHLAEFLPCNAQQPVSARSAPPAVTVKTAAAEQQHKHNDDQQQVHSILQKK